MVLEKKIVLVMVMVLDKVMVMLMVIVMVFDSYDGEDGEFDGDGVG